MVNIMEIFASVMTAFGDVFIFTTFICALMVFAINIANTKSKSKRRIPVQFLILGWVTFIVSYMGLVSISRTDAFGVDIGLVFSMPLMIGVLILYFSFALLLLGTAWTLRSRRLVKEAREARQDESLGQSVTA
jgi:H+/gluconate symporter-like permease